MLNFSRRVRKPTLQMPRVFVIIPWSGDRHKQLVRLLHKLTDVRVVCVRCDQRPFNRGLVKNAGFLEADPDDGDTVCFHDVDIMPATPTYPACEDAMTVRHLYGHRHCLGGVLLMQAGLFRRANGFPVDQWAWGGEDRQLQVAVEGCGAAVDRTWFSPRFTGVAFAEMDTDGNPMAHREARAAFATKQPHTNARLRPSALDRTEYAVTRREEMGVGVIYITIATT